MAWYSGGLSTISNTGGPITGNKNSTTGSLVPLNGTQGSLIGGVSDYFASKDPTNSSKSNAGYDAAKTSVDTQNTANQGQLDKLKQAGDTYTGGLTNTTNNYVGGVQSNTANSVSGLNKYAATTNNELSSLTNSAISNAQGAETLQQLEDPNSNPWAQNVQKDYNNQAQGIQNQGLASYGVLSALGSQATGQGLASSGVPFTGGQLQTLQSANLSQAGNEFANAQSRANSLRAQGLQAGINQANIAYGYGQQAQQAAVGDVGAQSQNAQGYINDINGIQNTGLQDVYNAQSGLAGAVYGTQVGQVNAGLGQNDLYYGAQQGLDTGQAQAAAAAAAGTLKGVTGVGGTVLGSAVGNGGLLNSGSSSTGAATGAGGDATAAAGEEAVGEGAVGAAGLTDQNNTQQQGYSQTPQGTSYSPYVSSPGTQPVGYNGQTATGYAGGNGYAPGSSLQQNPYNSNPYSSYR